VASQMEQIRQVAASTGCFLSLCTAALRLPDTYGALLMPQRTATGDTYVYRWWFTKNRSSYRTACLLARQSLSRLAGQCYTSYCDRIDAHESERPLKERKAKADKSADAAVPMQPLHKSEPRSRADYRFSEDQGAHRRSVIPTVPT
jgi:hypothetical protein